MDFESTSSAIPTSRLSISDYYLIKIVEKLQLFFYLNTEKGSRKHSIPFPAAKFSASGSDFLSHNILMMEQTNSCKRHNHAVFIAGFNYIVIPDRAARLCNILNTALMSPLNIVSKGEECI